MGEITLNEVAAALAFVLLLGGNIVALIKGVKSVLKKMFDEMTKTIVTRLGKQEEAIKKIDSDNCKNYVIQALASVERGVILSTEEKMRFAEEYEHYIDGGGNSYIKDWYGKLKKEGKI